MVKKKQVNRPNRTGLKIGDSVIVKPYLMDEDFPEVCLGGWQGRVTELLEDQLVEVAWDSITLLEFPDVYIRRSNQELLAWQSYHLFGSDVQKAAARDTVQDVERVIAKIKKEHEWDDLSDNHPIAMDVLRGLSRRDETACAIAWNEYLSDNLTFPFPAIVRETYWKNRPVAPGDKVEVIRLDGIDDETGIAALVTFNGRKSSVPLGELEVEDLTANADILDNYAAWYETI